jgi:sensor histidine kinase YesM
MIRKLTIKNKISLFTVAVFIILCMAVVLNTLIIKTLVMDFNDILEDNASSVRVVSAIDSEATAFQEYIRRPTDVNYEALAKSMIDTDDVLSSISLDYSRLGARRFAQLQSIKTSYEVYVKSRDEILDGNIANKMYIRKLYTVYDMQEYLYQYAQTFMFTTLEEGNVIYSKILPTALRLPVVAVIIGIVFLIVLIQLSKMLNKTIVEPVIKLANASRRIAANDFFIEDVTADNEDEIGDLVKAFNKMKYATGEYIMALEDRREALDRLHAQEINNLETLKQLETMNLELLKSQINPHFLFNTLNVIGGMANLEEAQVTEKMIGALSSLFRYNLKMQDAEVILAQEIKVANDYMYLQQMRFGSRVGYEVDCGVDADKVLVPTFTFQPLLENSIIHGLSPKIEGGRIKLSISSNGDMLCMIISDTGIGMDKDKLAELRSSLEKNETDKHGIGVGNIYKRIYSMYENRSMTIESVEGEGTKVTIMIPYHTHISEE